MRFTKITVLLTAVLFCGTRVDRALADRFGSGANTFDIEFVDIGNPGNPADTTGDPNPAGSVPYAYRMGKYEISEQMIDKANAEGGLGITKDNRGPDKPATSVNWFEAARFVNWLNTNSGSTPAYKFDGSGNFQLWTPIDAGYNPNNLYRSSLARYFLPSVDEWYKAAYYDPAGGIYYDYPTGSNSVPDGIDFAGDAVFDAVFYDGYDQGQPNDIINAGVLSPYGTMAQAANVAEWEETDSDLVNDSSSSSRGERGGSWNGGPFYFSVSFRTAYVPSSEVVDIGFRVASSAIPEPGTLLLGMVAGVVCLLPRRR